MILKQLLPQLYAIQLGMVNVHLIDSGELTVIDTGWGDGAVRIAEAVRKLGRDVGDVRHILVTHCHPDHAGGLAALKALTGAQAYMHPMDAAVVRGEIPGRPLHPAPGLLNHVLSRVFIPSPPWAMPLVSVEHEILDGDELPVAGGLRAIHVPGHCSGQMAFLWPRHGGVLFAGDVAANAIGLRLSACYEDLSTGIGSLAKLAGLRFETACFGHGNPIPRGAWREFQRRWGR